MKNILRYLFRKSPMNRRWIFLIAIIPFSLLALMGAEYGAFFLYFWPALLCLIQFIYPTIFLWGIFLIVFLSGSVAYFILILKDIYKLIVGSSPSILIDFDDSIVFILFFIILVAITLGIFLSRPHRTSAEGDNSNRIIGKTTQHLT